MYPATTVPLFSIGSISYRAEVTPLNQTGTHILHTSNAKALEVFISSYLHASALHNDLKPGERVELTVNVPDVSPAPRFMYQFTAVSNPLCRA